MKFTLFAITLMAGAFLSSELCLATEPAAQKQAPAQTEKAGKRKKRVQVCKECGKPETQCECEGHGNEKEHSEHKKEEAK